MYMWRNNMSYFHIFHLHNQNSEQCAQVWVTTFLNANYNQLDDIFQACHAYAISITIWSKLMVIILWHRENSIQDTSQFKINLKLRGWVVGIEKKIFWFHQFTFIVIRTQSQQSIISPFLIFLWITTWDKSNLIILSYLRKVYRCNEEHVLVAKQALISKMHHG